MDPQGPTADTYYPYKPGTLIKVEFRPEALDISGQDDILPQKPEILFFKVLRTLSRTLSCVLLVDLVPESGSQTAGHLSSTSPHILKLLDRRFADAHREEYNATPWTPSTEAEFAAFKSIPEHEKPHLSVKRGDNSWEYDPGARATDVASGDSEEAMNPAKRKIHPDEWSIGHREAYLDIHCEKLYSQEVQVYRALADIQGDLVPRLYGTITVTRKNKKGKRKVQCRGMLIEYMRDSFSLRDIPDRVPDQARWQELGSGAVRLVQNVGDMGVLNKDVRLDNVLVVPIQGDAFASDSAADGERYKLVMIDFGLARLQYDDESDEDFRRARIAQDEEGGVGHVLSKFLFDYAKGRKLLTENVPFTIVLRADWRGLGMMRTINSGIRCIIFCLIQYPWKLEGFSILEGY